MDYESGLCIECRTFYGEQITKLLMQLIFQDKFYKVKFPWLLSELGYPMELDGYCEKEKLGFEYQGEQHYNFVPLFHKSIETFHRKLRDNERKMKLCREHNITLIRIPNTIAFNDIQIFIENEFEKLTGQKVPVTSKINIKNLNIWNENQKSLLDFGIDINRIDDDEDFNEND